MDNCKNSVRTYMGKESEKTVEGCVCVCVCVKLNHLAVHLKHNMANQLYSNIK